MSFWAILLLVVALSVAVSLGAARLVTGPWLSGRTTRLTSGLVGVALCAAAAFAALYALDPDPVYGAGDWLSRARRALPVTGLSAIVWLPVYLAAFTAGWKRAAS